MNLDITFFFSQVSSVKYLVFDSTSWHLMMMMMMKLSSHLVFRGFLWVFLRNRCLLVLKMQKQDPSV